MTQDDLQAPDIQPLGEAAVLVTFGHEISPLIARRIRAFATRVVEAQVNGVIDIVSGYATLALHFDPRRNSLSRVCEQVARVLESDPAEAAEIAGTAFTIPVRYDGEDLIAVAEHAGLTVQDVIARHAARTYTVYMMGFVPGFAYMGKLDPDLVVPRRSSPRQRVPAGSVAIAGEQTAVYPLNTPGGWHLLGTTSLALFDPRRDPPALLQPGDTVRFEPIQ